MGKDEFIRKAYLKELMLSSMVQWMANDRTLPMDEVIEQQRVVLQRQLKPVVEEKKKVSRPFKLLKRASLAW